MHVHTFLRRRRRRRRRVKKRRTMRLKVVKRLLHDEEDLNIA
jgi:hypothetical protein